MCDRPSFRHLVLVVSTLPTLLWTAVHAETEPDPVYEEIVVRAHPLSAEGMAQPVTVVAGDALERALAPSLGETLRDQPGVHSASFGQAVGQPVIRGLGGARVKTMEDRIDSMDVSVSSPDHATTIEPYTADAIEVLKGPSTLLYGSGAIGGVVDVHTGRVPHQVPEQVALNAELRGADNADQRTAAGRLDAGAGDFAFHVDGFYRDADDYEIPGYAESAALRALEEEHDEHEDELEHEGEHGEHEEEAYGELPGSDLEIRGGAFGVSYVGDAGFIGLAVSSYDADYGLPGHSHAHGHEEEGHEEEEEHGEHEEEGSASLDLDQTRIDFEAGLEAPLQGIESMNLRIGYNDYEHTEAEGNGEMGTTFSNEATEGRFELVHERRWGIRGAAGLQFSTREFSAIGEEAFVPPVDTNTFGLFYVGRRDLGQTSIEAGVRYEHVEQDPSEGISRKFDHGSASVGLSHLLAERWTLSGQFDYSNRAPVAEELYSDGPHLVTDTYEIGDPALDEERAANVSASLGYEWDALRFTLSGYYTDFTDFIYQSATGEEVDELMVLEWQQADATFSGGEIDLSWQAIAWESGAVTLNAGMDVVRARLKSGDNKNLPRIPPQRWRLGAIVEWRSFIAELAWLTVDDQNDTAEGELPTEGYDDLRLHLAYNFRLGGNSDLQLFFNGRNLTDDEQRYHTSFIKDFAPQPGRTLEAGVRLRM